MVGDDEYQSARERIYKIIQNKGSHGITKRELQRSKAHNHREEVLKEVLYDLSDEGFIKQVSISAKRDGGGMPRKAWVATQLKDADAYDLATPAFCPRCGQHNPSWPDCESCGHRFDQ